MDKIEGSANMRNKRWISALVIGSMLLAACAGCGQSGGEAGKADGDGVVTLKFANSQTPEETCSKEIEAFAERVKEKTDGKVVIEVHHNGVLGDDNDALEACARGANYLTYVDPAAMCYYVPDYAVMLGPYLFDDIAQIKKLAFSDYGDEMVEKAAEAGIRVLDHMSSYYGTRVFIGNKPVPTPDEMKGMKVRVPSVPLWIEMLTAMGANTTTISFSEVYTALSQGVADGMENPLPAIYAARFHEVCKYVSETNHIIQPNGIEMSEAVFQSLTPEQQKILEEEAIVFAETVTEKVQEEEKEVREKMTGEGVEFVACDTDAYRAATESVYQKFPEWSEGLYDRVTAIIRA